MDERTATLAGRSAGLVQTFLESQVPEPSRISTVLHPDDEMLDFCRKLHSGAMDLARVTYFRSGLLAHLTFRQVLSWRFGEPARAPSILDFASGFGRVTRFLAAEVAPERLWVAEIKPEAVRFQERLLGVRGLVTTREPRELACDRRFSAILVASLFSHLPRATFVPWLARLYTLLEEGGVLAFSVHDQATLPAGREMPGEGFHFEALSESRDLDRADYGSTWVSEAYVRQALCEAAGHAVPHARFPLGLWHSQDLYVVVRGQGPDLGTLELDRGPEGYLDACRLTRAGDLVVGGWALDRGPAAEPVTVEVLINGERVAQRVPDAERPDVPRRQEEPHRPAGWEMELQGPIEPSDVLMVKAKTATGRQLVLHLSSVETATLWLVAREQRSQLLALRQELADVSRSLAETRSLAAEQAQRVQALEQRIAAMQASRFWKLRNAWFSLKRGLGLTDEA